MKRQTWGSLLTSFLIQQAVSGEATTISVKMAITPDQLQEAVSNVMTNNPWKDMDDSGGSGQEVEAAAAGTTSSSSSSSSEVETTTTTSSTQHGDNDAVMNASNTSTTTSATTTMELEPSESPTPSTKSSLSLKLPSHLAAPKLEGDDNASGSMGAWSEWSSIADNNNTVSSVKSSSSHPAAAGASRTTTVLREHIDTNNNNAIKSSSRDDGDLPSLSGRRNCEPPETNQHNYSNTTSSNSNKNDPPEFGYRTQNNRNRHVSSSSTAASSAAIGIHNIRTNAHGKVYLDDEDSFANSSKASSVVSGGGGGRLAAHINSMMKSPNNNNRNQDDNETITTRYSTSSTISPPPPSDYFNQPSQRQLYPMEPSSSSSVGSSEATSIASNTTRSTTTTATNIKSHENNGGVMATGSSALGRHLSNNNNTNNNRKTKQDPEDYFTHIKPQDPRYFNDNDDQHGYDDAFIDYSSKPNYEDSDADSSVNASRSAMKDLRYAQESRRALNLEIQPFIGRGGQQQQQQQQRVVYASSARRDMNNYRNVHPNNSNKAKDSDLESGLTASHQQHQQRVRFADKIFTSRQGTALSNTSSSYVSSKSSSYGLSWRDRSVTSSDNSSVASKISIDGSSSQSSSSTFSNRSRGSSISSGGSNVGNTVLTLGRGVSSVLYSMHSVLGDLCCTTSSTTAAAPGSGNTRSSSNDTSNSVRYNYLKRYTTLLAIMSIMMLLTIGSYSGAFFGASDNPTRGLGMNHDMRPPSMGIMHNVPHQEMLKRGGVNGDNMNGAPSQSVENGQVVDWDKVPPHLRGYYSKVFGVQPGGGR